MAERYNHADIESKWQKQWEADGLYQSDVDESKPKYYAMTMLPYPSGDLHIGHWYAMAPSDARARYLRMNGYNVVFPMGFDAFGLPAENAAMKRGIHPYEWTIANIENMRKQLRSMGAMFDWRREAVTCLPGYYGWSQWFFLKMYEMGLVIAPFRPWIFARSAIRRWRASRCGARTATASAATPRWSKKSSTSGFSRSQTMRTNCWISPRSSGPNGSGSCRRTGWGAARARG